VCLNQLVCFADQCNASRFDVADHTETATPALSWAVARAAVAFGSDYLQSALPREGVAIPKSPVPPSGNPSAVRHLIWPIYGTFRRPPPQQRIWSELAQRMTIKRRGRRQAARMPLLAKTAVRLAQKLLQSLTLHSGMQRKLRRKFKK